MNEKIINFFKISIPAYVNDKIEIVDTLIGDFDVNSTLWKSNYVLNLVFHMMKNDGFYNSNFNKISKYVEFHKHRVSRMILKIICHFLIDSSNEKEPDLNNNVTGLEPNADIFSFRHENSG